MIVVVSKLNSGILQCIDAGLDTIGASKTVLYWYLSQKGHLDRENIPENPTKFLEALKALFGQGAGILERTITRELKRVFNVTLGDGLVEVLALIKRTDSSPTAGDHARTSLAGSLSDS